MSLSRQSRRDKKIALRAIKAAARGRPQITPDENLAMRRAGRFGLYILLNGGRPGGRGWTIYSRANGAKIGHYDAPRNQLRLFGRGVPVLDADDALRRAAAVANNGPAPTPGA